MTGGLKIVAEQNSRSGAEPPRVLAIASGGGHWVQLRRIHAAWEGCSVAYVTTNEGYRAEVMADSYADAPSSPEFHVIPDANRWQKLRLLRQLIAVSRVIARFRPTIVVTTGAAPGYFAIRVAKLMGARAIWIDSIANADELSMSGRKAGKHVDMFLTQWPHLAKPDGPHHVGSVI